MLPAELRVFVYEELLEHEGKGAKSLSPQILLACKQINREAQPILDNNLKRLSFIRIHADDDGVTIKHGEAPSTQIDRIKHLSAASDAVPPVPTGHTHAIIHLHLADRTFASQIHTSFLLNQHLYLLVAQLNNSKILSLSLSLSLRSRTKHSSDPEAYDWRTILWPLTRVGPKVTVSHRHSDISQASFQHLSSPRVQDEMPVTTLSTFLKLRRNVEVFSEISMEAGVNSDEARRVVERLCGQRFLPDLDRGLVCYPMTAKQMEELVGERYQETMRVLDGDWFRQAVLDSMVFPGVQQAF